MPLGRRGQTHSATHFAELTAVFNLDEEHRLMYLGITRAKELLTLSWSAPNATARSTATSPATSAREADLHWQGKDPEADKEVTRETAESHMAKIAAMLGSR
jgi:ATP-dependent DNA helicase Rep